MKKKVEIKTIVEVQVCDVCGKEAEYKEGWGYLSIETCMQCGKDLCPTHSEYYGGKCKYVVEEGMWCPECSIGKKTVTKWDREQ